MKITLFAASFCLMFASFAFAQNDEINIVPKPHFVKVLDGKFTLSAKTKIVVTEDTGRQIAPILNEIVFRNFGFRLAVTNKVQRTNAINLFPEVSDGDLSIDPESYSLRIDQNSIRISGRAAGMFYALQSLVQLFPAERTKEIKLPAVQIADEPRFGYRGMHLDVSRHFFPVEFVKKYIDLMSQYKFNTFHWHLTDDQGWRIEIKKYPRLTEIGSKRSESLVGRYSTEFKGDGVPVEGFYTQEQIRDVVAYAKARYITVIPEIEMPGHASAAIASYPELGCKADYKYEVKKTWGIFKEVFCPTEKTFSFLEDVISETIALFPDSPYIHIGGDEVLKDMWKESPEVATLMKNEGLKDEHEVQSYFIRRMEKFINSKGKKIIGWDEILEGGLAPNATVMSWRGIKGGIEAAKAHHDVIMTPTDYAYLDYGQGDPATEPLNIGGYLPLEKVYGYDPVPKELSADEAKYILGAQANIWTEYLPTTQSVEYMAFPRMLAIAEDVWSTPENKNFADFSKRLAANLPRLDKQNVNYRIPEPAGLQNQVVGKDGIVSVELRPSVPGSKLFWSVDGSVPDTSGEGKPAAQIDLKLGEGETREIKTITVLPSGRKSSIYAATLIRRDYLASVPEIKDKRPGVTFALYNPTVIDAPRITGGETRSIGLSQLFAGRIPKLPFDVAFDGYINMPADGIYEFQAESTWDTAMIVDGEKLFDDTGSKDRKIRSAVLPLKAGWHKISLHYSNRGGDPYWRVRWAIKGQNWRNIGGGELVH